MNPTYSVPIIPYYLSNHETIIQIAEVLDHLSNVTEDILNRVNSRVESNTKRLNNLSERVDVVNTKINSLKGAKKATQVFSSAKYPASEVNQDYVSIFDKVTPITLIRHKVRHKNKPISNEPLDKLQLYHVKVSENNKTVKKDGLGDKPTDLECVNDLLLYNSGKNLYNKFEISDALKGPQHIKEDDTNDVSDLGAAPYSISERSNQTNPALQPYFYTPKIGDVPELDVPSDLPDLPGIADDICYTNEIGPGIAPSVLTPSEVNLPTFEILKDSTESNISEVDLPPPPSLVEVQQPDKVQDIVPDLPKLEVNVYTSLQDVELPKPPSPKLLEPSEPPQNVSKISSSTSKSTAGSADARASLMDAIRKAGGSKVLKTIDNSAKKAAVPSGDLMADLHSKLSMRRKGISGAKKSEQENGQIDANSTLSKISAMIPPPSKSDLNESTATEDEDWDE